MKNLLFFIFFCSFSINIQQLNFSQVLLKMNAIHCIFSKRILDYEQKNLPSECEIVFFNSTSSNCRFLLKTLLSSHKSLQNKFDFLKNIFTDDEFIFCCFHIIYKLRFDSTGRRKLQYNNDNIIVNLVQLSNNIVFWSIYSDLETILEDYIHGRDALSAFEMSYESLF